jgi:hypothetical protein
MGNRRPAWRTARRTRSRQRCDPADVQSGLSAAGMFSGGRANDRIPQPGRRRFPAAPIYGGSDFYIDGIIGLPG